MSERGELPRAKIIGGPVCTRTADHSLHVNLVPGDGRRCTFDCVYCPFPCANDGLSWRLPGDIGTAVMNALHNAPEIDSITVSGPANPRCTRGSAARSPISCPRARCGPSCRSAS